MMYCRRRVHINGPAALEERKERKKIRLQEAGASRQSPIFSVCKPHARVDATLDVTLHAASKNRGVVRATLLPRSRRVARNQR